jgi:UDP-N-acetylmuramoyl-tripeptide--D-alanyl-D-alanine ligase
MKLPLSRVAEFISAAGTFDGAAEAVGYSLDSRTLAPGELFFAVRGERLDGHDYLEAALRAGAVAAVIAKDQATRFLGPGCPTLVAPPLGDRVGVERNLLLVDDPLTALQSLALAVRKLWGKSLIGITGSTGKTTTKEALAHLLSAQYRVHKSVGNLNNHFGLPLQLLKLEPEHEIAVIELGMSHAGEIAALARLAQPDLGVVTNVAPVHLEFFSSVAEIARAKYELIEALPASGVAVLNADDEYVAQFGRDFPGRVVTYGLHHPADVRADAVTPRGAAGSEFDLIAGDARAHAHLPLVGRHNVYNALAAVATALTRGIGLAPAASALAGLTAGDKRGQLLEVGGAIVVNDCYNSNPRALDSMVDLVAGMPVRDGARRIVVAGEMLELGSAAPELHRRCGRHMAERGMDVVVGVRGAARHIAEAARAAGLHAEFLETPEHAAQWLAREVRPGDLVLLKASRGVRLERALEEWKRLSN